MNGKAVIAQSVDFPTAEALRFTFNVAFFTTEGFHSTHNVDVFFDSSDTLSQMKTKVRNTMITKGAELGITLIASDVSSIMQI